MKTKRTKQKGKIRLSIYFQNLAIGDKVGVVREQSIAANFPKRIQGKTGIIESKRGRSYVVKLNDINQEKRFIISAIHLKKVK